MNCASMIRKTVRAAIADAPAGLPSRFTTLRFFQRFPNVWPQAVSITKW